MKVKVKKETSPQPEDIFLLCVVGGNLGGAVDQINGCLALERISRVGAVRLLVLVEEYLTLLQHDANLLPRPERQGVRALRQIDDEVQVLSIKLFHL